MGEQDVLRCSEDQSPDVVTHFVWFNVLGGLVYYVVGGFCLSSFFIYTGVVLNTDLKVAQFRRSQIAYAENIIFALCF